MRAEPRGAVRIARLIRLPPDRIGFDVSKVWEVIGDWEAVLRCAGRQQVLARLVRGPEISDESCSDISPVRR